MNHHFYSHAHIPMAFQGQPFVPPQPAPAPPGHRSLQSQDLILDIPQQPKEALVTLDGKEKARKPVDPPPIIQLKVNTHADPNQHFLQSPYLFMTCSLVSKDDGSSVKTQDGKPTLSGSLTSSLHRLKDTNSTDGGFFVFGDVSVKVVGVHRLKFCLFDLHKDTSEAFFLAEITTDPFKVVAQKDFRGLEESTYLSRAFSDQGVRLRLRKEPRAFGNGGQKRNYNSFGGMPAHQESMRRSQEVSYDFGHDSSLSPGGKRQRFNSDSNGPSQQHAYGSSIHQPVRTPESANSAFPASASYNASAFEFKHPLQMPTQSQYESASSTHGGIQSQDFRQMPGNYSYPTPNLFEVSHQPHGIVGFSSSSMQPGMREDHEAADSLQSLAVRSHSGDIAGQSTHGPENSYSGYVGTSPIEDSFDPTLTTGGVLPRPKGRYEERVDNHMHQLKSTKEEDTSAQHYQNGPPYFNDHMAVQQQDSSQAL